MGEDWFVASRQEWGADEGSREGGTTDDGRQGEMLRVYMWQRDSELSSRERHGHGETWVYALPRPKPSKEVDGRHKAGAHVHGDVDDTSEQTTPQ